MEDILGYIIIFGLLIIFTWIYFSNKEKRKEYSLTKKDYSFGTLDILIRKSGSKIICFFLKVSSKSNIKFINIELITKKREIIKIDLPEEFLTREDELNYCIDYDNLSSFLEEKKELFDTFRFVVTLENTKILKSAAIAFNKHWKIILPDSGSYN